MQGRVEHQIKNLEKCKNILKEMPDYVEDYYLALMASNKESTTCLAYLNKIKKMLNYLGNPQHISDISEREVAKFLIDIGTKNNNGTIEETSFSNRKQYHAILHSFFNYYVNTGKIAVSPMMAISRPRNKDNVKHVKLDKIDFHNIIDSVENNNESPYWIKERDKTIIKMFMSTGMRKTALTEINIEDINFDERELVIVDKRHKTHTYYLTESLCNQIKAYISERNKRNNIKNKEALFISQVGTRLSNVGINDIVYKYTEKGIGKKLSPHKLRGGFCTILYDETHDIEFVREAVGHSNISTTQRYISKDNSAKRQAAILMEDNLNNIE